MSNQDIAVYGGKQMLNLVHAQDVARTIALTLNGGFVGETFNVGAKHSITVEELVRKILIITIQSFSHSEDYAPTLHTPLAKILEKDVVKELLIVSIEERVNYRL